MFEGVCWNCSLIMSHLQLSNVVLETLEQPGLLGDFEREKKHSRILRGYILCFNGGIKMYSIKDKYMYYRSILT